MKAKVLTRMSGAYRSRGFVLLAQATLVLVLAASLLVATASAQNQVYVVTSNQQFGTVDLSNGAFHQIGANTPEGQANLVWGPQGVLYSLTFSGNLEKIDPATGAATVVGPTGLGFNAFDLGGVRGNLYATDFGNNIYSVDPNTGAASLLAATGMPADPAIPFTFNADGTMNLCDETLYGLSGQLYATFDAFTLDPGTLAVTPTVAAGLYRIDPATGAATFIAPTDMNLGSTVATSSGFYAFKWITTAFTEFGPQPQSEITKLNLVTGQTSVIGLVDPAAGGITGAAPVRVR